MKRVLVPILLFVVGCSGGGDDDPIVIDFGSEPIPDMGMAADVEVDVADEDLRDTVDMGFEIPGSPAGAQLSWLLGVLNGSSAPTTAEVTEHFAASFLNAINAADLVQVLAQLRGFRPWEPLQFIGDPTDTAIQVAATTTNGVWKIQLATTGGLISGLLFAPAPEYGDYPATWEELDSAAQAQAELADVYVAEVADGTCSDVHVYADDQAVALGSAFKIYVLDAWVEGVIAGDHAWTDELELLPEYKSLPSGDLQALPDNTMVEALTAAQKMIEISDNTGTDLLIRALGRPRVEAAMEATGHTSPQLNRPFLLTRELFQLKVPNDTAEMDAYVAMSEAERRDFLNVTLAARGLPLLTGAWTLPRHIDTLEWFATGADLCKVAAKFQERAQTEPDFQTALDILARNPGMSYDAMPTEFPYVGFKGGSEPGVLVATWLLQRADGRWFFVFIALNDTAAAIDQLSTTSLYYGAFQLVRGI